MKTATKQMACLSLILATAVVFLITAGAQNARGSATGPTAKGYSHPDQFIHLQDVEPADNMYPVIPDPEQEKQARDKLVALRMKSS